MSILSPDYLMLLLNQHLAATTPRVLADHTEAPWCRNCQKMLRYMKKIAQEEKLGATEPSWFPSVPFGQDYGKHLLVQVAFTKVSFSF